MTFVPCLAVICTAILPSLHCLPPRIKALLVVDGRRASPTWPGALGASSTTTTASLDDIPPPEWYSVYCWTVIRVCDEKFRVTRPWILTPIRRLPQAAIAFTTTLVVILPAFVHSQLPTDVLPKRTDTGEPHTYYGYQKKMALPPYLLVITPPFKIPNPGECTAPPCLHTVNLYAYTTAVL